MTHSAAGLDAAALETPLTLHGNALGERPVRFRRGDVPPRVPPAFRLSGGAPDLRGARAREAARA
jgi:hypothetical protein